MNWAYTSRHNSGADDTEKKQHALSLSTLLERWVPWSLPQGHGPRNINSKDLLERLGYTFSHEEPWGAQELMHPFYRLKPEQYRR